MGPTIREVGKFLEDFAPKQLAEDWDNVGLLVGKAESSVSRVMTCLTVTPDSVAEAVAEKADLIVTHHPFPFRGVKQITDHTTVGKMLLQLIEAKVAVYSPHTAFDSAENGINQQFAVGLGLSDIRPILENSVASDALGANLGSGRFGKSALETVSALAQAVKDLLGISQLKLVGDPLAPCSLVGIACGAAGEFLRPAQRAGCDTLITGETTFHTVLEAQARGTTLILTGHYHSERFAVESLAEVLRQAFDGVEVWPSQREQDPITWV